ncbi:hypothetical protein PRZ48_005121 [Zasmidium cellare]|uniref:EthD domain-containing protein n=1 Tax=Zasmidium cellare TaxID=395010 RepID=A0ABR0ESH0_ZASCE|nr:hypothetical protein PRZ48_005121 [Zasmidium cellare]
MPAPYLLFVLSRPHAIPASAWEAFYHTAHLDDLIHHKVATKGAMYAQIANPMNRPPPDTHTHLVLFETEHEKPFESIGFKDVDNTSPQFPPGKSTPDVADLECRHYELLEVFDSKGKGTEGRAAEFVLQTEIRIEDVDALRRFYREEHIPLMAEHPGYQRAIMYRYLETSVVYGVDVDDRPGNRVVVIHEFASFEGLGGPLTRAALETEYALEVRRQIQSLTARAL